MRTGRHRRGHTPWRLCPARLSPSAPRFPFLPEASCSGLRGAFQPPRPSSSSSSFAPFPGARAGRARAGQRRRGATRVPAAGGSGSHEEGRGDRAPRAPTGGVGARARGGGRRSDATAAANTRLYHQLLPHQHHTAATPGNSSCSQPTYARTHPRARTHTRSHARTCQRPLLIHSCYNLHDVPCADPERPSPTTGEPLPASPRSASARGAARKGGQPSTHLQGRERRRS